jgi:glyoxylase-like metal-dependent hydrolase (beta-lactamase superfamily II)
MQIADNVYCVPGVIANVFVLVDPDGVTLVDAGLPYNQRTILAYLARLGFPPAALRRILVTHADRDHIGSVAALQALTGARVYASPLEAEALALGRETRRLHVGPWMRFALGLLSRFVFVKIRPAVVDGRLADGQELPVLGGLSALATPGHTPGHLSFYAAGPGILFAGDSLRTLGGRLRVSSGPNTLDEAQANASARRQLALNPRLICAGHGPAVSL